MSKDARKFETLIQIEGLTFDEFMEQYSFESVVPAICMNDGCDYVAAMEPEGWCPECRTQSLCSGTILLMGGVL